MISKSPVAENISIAHESPFVHWMYGFVSPMVADAAVQAVVCHDVTDTSGLSRLRLWIKWLQPHNYNPSVPVDNRQTQQA